MNDRKKALQKFKNRTINKNRLKTTGINVIKESRVYLKAKSET